MNQFKRAQVVMLPTTNSPLKGELILRHIWKNTKNECNTLWQFKEDVIISGIRQFITLNGSFRDIYTAFKSQHLYVISDDEIKEGDVVYHIKNDNMLLLIKDTLIMYEKCTYKLEYKKIIATTDTSLGYNKSFINPINNKADNKWISLPQPSQQFIEKYIESYNKGEVITDVLVEYNTTCNKLYCSSAYKLSVKCTSPNNCQFNTLKINSKDNTITIKKLKNSWNREEVTSLIELAWAIASAYGENTNSEDCIDWINHNL